VLSVLSIHYARSASTCWHGVNLSGLEFGSTIPGVYAKDYIDPNASEVDYFTGKGMNFFRLPFRWERLQSAQNGAFNADYLQLLTKFVNYATSKGAYVLLDPHNYARYYNGIVGTDVPASAFADFWQKLAAAFMANPRVLFGLMNEPNTMQTETWLTDTNAAIAAIRATGAKQTIFVPGNAWTGAWSWNQNWYGTPNGQVMKGVVDPIKNFIFEVHQYLDQDSSGTSDSCVNNTIGSQRLQEFTTWARQNNYRAVLGEFAGGRTAVCYQALSNALDFMDANSDVYLGWSWWGAGPWWGEYIFALDPVNGQDRPQMQYLVPHLTPGTCPSL